MKKLDIVIPCFNEAECIGLVYERINEVLQDWIDWSVIFVNDGSTDQTKEAINCLLESYGAQKIKYVSFSRNFGKEAAIAAGLSKTKAEYIVLMDADLQHPPEMLPEMITALDEGYDVCGARRVSRTGEPKIRSALSKAFYSIINRVTSMQLVPGGSDYRMMKRPVVEALLSLQERGRFTKGLLSWVGFSTKWIPYENVERAAGKTKWSVRSLTSYAINGFFSFATTPLRIAIIVGFLIDIITLIAGIHFIVSSLISDGPRTGFGTIVTLVAFFGGTIIMLLGILGEYLARIYMEVKRRPLYIIEESNVEE